MHIRLSILFCLLAGIINAQNTYELIGGDIRLRVNANGVLAIDPSSLNPSSAFQGTSNHFLNQAGLFISARDQNNNLYTAIQMINSPDQYDFWPGPLDTFTGAPGQGNWNYVWKISQSEISNHKKNFNSDDYNMPEGIANWPAYNESGTDLVPYLAPFADFNANHIYDPENGDYPFIKGDESIYLICNDNAGEHKVSFGPPLVLEVHLMLYRYYEESTIYLEYYIINRSKIDYTSLNVGFFLGGECGNSGDNHAGTLIDRNTVFIYNADTLDELYFGSDLPYVYASFLNRNLDGSIYWDYSNDSLSGLPVTAWEFEHFLNGRWRNGDGISYGENAKMSGMLYPYVYVHNSDPDRNFWSEETAGIPGGARNILARSDFQGLHSGEHLKIDICLGAGLISNGKPAYRVVAEDVDRARDYFLQHSAIGDQKIKLAARQYPNPCKDNFFIEVYKTSEYEIKISDIQGLVHFIEKQWINNKYQCNINLRSGIYLLEVRSNDGQIFNKLVHVQP